MVKEVILIGIFDVVHVLEENKEDRK